jgi:hypothetical protein
MCISELEWRYGSAIFALVKPHEFWPLDDFKFAAGNNDPGPVAFA